MGRHDCRGEKGGGRYGKEVGCMCHTGGPFLGFVESGRVGWLDDGLRTAGSRANIKSANMGRNQRRIDRYTFTLVSPLAGGLI